MDTKTEYTGTDSLEVMAEAVKYNAWLCSLITSRAPKGCKVLDFGAGAGTFAEAVQRAGYEVCCVEPDAYLRTLLTSKGLRNAGELADIPAASVDFVFTLNVLEHIENDHAAMRELVSKLRPGGTLFVYVPAFEVLYSAMDVKVGHFRRYRLAPLKRMAANNGLTVRYARYGDSLGFLATLAYQLIGSSDGTINRGALKVYDTFLFPISRVLDFFLGRVIGKNAILEARR